ncbi:MAG: O-antigen ligase family protein [Methylocaldum sp.]|nr:O-antigen ligase family protein [Methylocaldum sp.]
MNEDAAKPVGSRGALITSAVPGQPLPETRFGTAIFVLLSVVLVFSTVAFGAVDTGSTAILSLVFAVVVILWAADAWITGGIRFNGSLLQIPIAALLLIGLVQLLPLNGRGEITGILHTAPVSSLSLDPYATRFFIVQLVYGLIFFAALLAFTNRSRLRKLVVAIIIFGSVMAFFGILQRLADPSAIYGIRPTPQSIPFGPFVNQHHFAAFMEMTGGLTMGLLFGRSVARDKRIFLVLAMIVMGTAVVLTSSRGGMLSFSAMVVFAVMAGARTGSKGRAHSENDSGSSLRHRVGLAAAVSGIGFLILGTVLLVGGDRSLVRGLGFSSGDDFTSGRSHFWRVGWNIFLDNPIIGAGLDAFGVAYSRYDTAIGLYRVERAHNDYLQILTDAGILGFLCVAAFIFLLFRKSLNVVGTAHDRFRRGAAI